MQARAGFANTRKRRPAWMRFGLALLYVCVALVLGRLVYAFFFEEDRVLSVDAVLKPPVLEAEIIKFKPDDPGGMEILHQDKLIYERLTPEGESPAEGVSPVVETEEPLEALLAARTTTEEPTPPKRLEEVIDMEDIGAPVETEEADAAAEPSGEYVVQLASFLKRSDAETERERLRRRLSELPNATRFDIQAADLGERGLWHRLLLGEFATRNEAQTLCQTLKERGQDCLVTLR